MRRLMQAGVALLGLCLVPAAAQTLDAKVLNPSEERLKVPAGTQVAVIFPRLVSTRDLSSVPTFLAADLSTPDGVVARSGTPVVLSLSSTGPKRLSVGATLDVGVVGVDSITGERIPLTRNYKVDGGLGCAMEGCAFVWIAPWLRGPHAEIQPGTLVGAYVDGDQTILASAVRAAEQEKRTAQAASEQPGTLGKLFVYLLPSRDIERKDSSEGFIAFHIDSKRIELLENTWTCVDLPAGPHTIEIERQRFDLQVEGNRSHYVKMVSAIAGLAPHVRETQSFELDGNMLRYYPNKMSRHERPKCW